MTSACPATEISRRSAPVDAHQLRVDVLTSFEAFLRIASGWDALVERAGIGHPFLGHDWVRSWWEAFGADRRLNILLAYHGEELIGIAPLMLARERMYGIPVRVMAAIYNDHTPRYDFVVARDHAAVCEAFWMQLQRQDGEWDFLRLCQLESDSPTLAHLLQFTTSRHWRLGLWASNQSPYLAVAGTFDQAFQKLPRGMRANTRRRLKRLQEIGPVEFETLTGQAALDDALAEAFRMEAGTWKGAAGTAIACDPAVTRFYSLVAHYASQSRELYLTFLRVNGERVAFDLSLIHAGRLFKLKPGYRQDLHACSPGQQLTCMTIEDAFHRGLQEVDFLGSADEWKLAWTQSVRKNVWVYVFQGNLMGSLLHTAKFWMAPRLAGLKLARLKLARLKKGSACW